jgi:nicotinamide mononucleotide transporter
MSPFETAAAGFGIVSVFLSTRQNIWSWPTSLINVTMYTVIFLEQKLYGLSGIQVFFAAVSVYGWYEWLHGGAHKTELKVSRTPPRLAGILVAVGLLGWLGLFLILRLVDDASPLLDAFFFASSLVAQWMMARKLAECWLLWIAINCISVPFFFFQHIYPTMVQYAVFLVLAVMGRSQWKASLAASS